MSAPTAEELVQRIKDVNNAYVEGRLAALREVREMVYGRCEAHDKALQWTCYRAPMSFDGPLAQGICHGVVEFRIPKVQGEANWSPTVKASLLRIAMREENIAI